ncbi:hypothetical protein VIGAN_01055800 [Vigna angularis var. angularis]|uniref:Uncharacterized protein n=1 Tax=Vigna angularis var. angularis TaxID=157739 RepID=A0A0S3QXM8_PHAAN|nr:hypothetical protein VIGAN_01055800 [Vigna angularis var. angularis]
MGKVSPKTLLSFAAPSLQVWLLLWKNVAALGRKGWRCCMPGREQRTMKRMSIRVLRCFPVNLVSHEKFRGAPKALTLIPFLYPRSNLFP